MEYGKYGISDCIFLTVFFLFNPPLRTLVGGYDIHLRHGENSMLFHMQICNIKESWRFNRNCKLYHYAENHSDIT